MSFAAVGGRLGMSVPALVPPGAPAPALRTIDSRMLGRALLRLWGGKRIEIIEVPTPAARSLATTSRPPGR